ncbi:hypothetical protein OE88DRAFT_1643092 [Heliocybe sulcata]|uniref:Uncharacterized protein n=1 Tax=Heliocybe sulcata TaxID=5364 RepID=A0A5C3N6I8_9AGAM|nr:hypothetical protein OE88DRAFT_1643092 [Heliocybe sulcata]
MYHQGFGGIVWLFALSRSSFRVSLSWSPPQGGIYKTLGHVCSEQEFLEDRIHYQTELFQSLQECEQEASDAVDEAYEAALSIAHCLYAKHFTNTSVELSLDNSELESAIEGLLADIIPPRCSTQLAALAGPEPNWPYDCAYHREHTNDYKYRMQLIQALSVGSLELNEVYCTQTQWTMVKRVYLLQT